MQDDQSNKPLKVLFFEGSPVVYTRQPPSLHAIHAWLWTFFGDSLDPDDQEQRQPFVYTLKRRGQANHIQVRAPMRASSSRSTISDGIQAVPKELEIATGLKSHFEITCAAHRHCSLTGKRQAIMKRGDLRVWFEQRAQAAGFEVNKIQSLKAAWKMGFSRKNGKKFPVYQISIKGELTVQNAELFANMYAHGMGPMRAYGCGMMFLHQK